MTETTPTAPSSANKPETVELVHPDSTNSLTVRADMVENYLGEGWREKAGDAPAGNASLEDWQQYARGKGFSDADLEGKKRAELVAALA